LSLAKSEIEASEKSKLSLMPEGLLETLSESEVRDLIAYLSGPDQPPLPAEAQEPAAAGGK